MTPQVWASIAAIVISAVASILTYRVNRSFDTREARVERLEADFNRFRLEVATQYIRSPEVDQLREDFERLRTEVHALAGAVNRLIGRLDGQKA